MTPRTTPKRPTPAPRGVRPAAGRQGAGKGTPAILERHGAATNAATERVRAAMAVCQAAGLSVVELARTLEIVRVGVHPNYLHAVRRGRFPANAEMVDALERRAASVAGKGA